MNSVKIGKFSLKKQAIEDKISTAFAIDKKIINDLCYVPDKGFVLKKMAAK